jgi:hypothetical protein
MIRYNQTFVDSWTAVHAGTGLVVGLAGVGPVMWGSAMIGFEIFEQTLEARGRKGPESAINVLGDLAFGLGFYVLGRKMRKAWLLG